MIKDLCRNEIFAIKPYVPGKPAEEVERELGICNVVKLASNENPLGPSPAAIAAIVETAPRVSVYPDGNCFYLKKELAAYLGVTAEHLIIGNGSDEIIKLIAEAFLSPGEEAIVADPTFSEYDFAVKIMGGVTVPVPLKNHTHDLKAMFAAVTEKTKLLFICNPNNPTGSIVEAEELRRLLESLPEKVLVVLDEAYYEYVTSVSYPESLSFIKEGHQVIVLRTFSKIYGLAGLRIGYGIASPDIIAALNRVREPFNVNLAAQVAARAALKDTVHVRLSQEMNEEGKRFLAGEFKRMGLDFVPTQANFFWLDIGADCVKVFGKLLQRGVIVRTGDIFGSPHVIRVTIGTKEQNRRFISMLEEVLAEEKLSQ